MTFKTYASMAIMLMLSLPLLANASNVNASLGSYLSTYMSNSTLLNSTVMNQGVNGTTYIVVTLPGIQNYTILTNSNGAYSFVTNVSLIDQVLTPSLSSSYYPGQQTLNTLNTTMHEYRQYSAHNLSECVSETGLDTNTCTFANNCFSCQTVPVCKKVLSNFGGVNTSFGLGVVNFSVEYHQLNNSYNTYFSLLSSINQNNAATVISQMSSTVDNISVLASKFNHNTVFPPPANLTFSQCSSGANPLKQPWYCVAVGFCSVVPFNSAALNNVQSTLTNIQTNLISPSEIAAVSANVSNNELDLTSDLNETQSNSSFTAMINTYYPQYNSIIKKSQALLTKYDNASLNLSIQNLKAKFSLIQSAGPNQSITTANTALQSLITNTTNIYTSASANYDQAYTLSQNNSAALLAAELSYRQTPSKLAQLSNQQQNINMQLNTRINSSQASALLPGARSVSLESALFIAPFDLGYLVKSVDTPFLTSVLAGANTPAQQKIAMAPIYAAVLSLIIGILVILVIFAIMYFRVIKKGKLKNNKGMGRKWMIVFVVLIIIVALYTYATYAFAQGASSFIPFNYFLMSIKASPTVYIALNGSAATNGSIIACANTIQSYLANASKPVQTIQLRNYSCVSGSNISTLGLSCYSSILDSGKPVILMSQSQNSQIVHKGLYGTVLYASGNVTVGSACTLSTLFKNV